MSTTTLDPDTEQMAQRGVPFEQVRTVQDVPGFSTRLDVRTVRTPS